MRTPAVVLALCIAGCNSTPLYKRLDPPVNPRIGGRVWGFDPGMAGSATNVWTSSANSGLIGPQELQHYDGSTWKAVTVPSFLTDPSVVPTLDIEALPSGDAAVLLTTTMTGQLRVARLSADGSFSDLSAAFSSLGSVMRQTVTLTKLDARVYVALSLQSQAYVFDGTAFSRVDPGLEAGIVAAAPDADFRIPIGDTVWRLNSGTLYEAFPNETMDVARLRVTRTVAGGAPQDAVLRAASGDLMGTGSNVTNGVIFVDSYSVVGLVRGSDDSVWLALIHDNKSEPFTRLIFRKIVGDTISREERLGIDIDACNTDPVTAECKEPRVISNSWAAGASPWFFSGGIGMKALLVPTGDLR